MSERISLTETDGSTSLLFGDRKLTVHQGDVLNLAADALVCPVGPSLSTNTGLAKIIVDAADIEPRDASPTLKSPFGNVVVLPGGKLRAKYIFLSVLLGERGLDNLQTSIRQAVDRSIHYAEFLRLKSIAFPLLGSAAGAPPFQFVARQMIEEVAQYLSRRKTRLKMILFSTHNAAAYTAFRREARSLSGG
jgi:O-acetyl-ADP-ribose deacetylase (regulator of RNase III)